LSVYPNGILVKKGVNTYKDYNPARSGYTCQWKKVNTLERPPGAKGARAEGGYKSLKYESAAECEKQCQDDRSCYAVFMNLLYYGSKQCVFYS